MKPTDATLYRRLARMASRYWLHIVGVFLLGMLSAPLALLLPIPLALVVDHVVGRAPLPGAVASILGSAPTAAAVLIVAVTMMIGINLARYVVSLAQGALREYTGERLVVEFQRQLFVHAQRLSLLYHDTRGTADTIYRIQSDAMSIKKVALDGLAPLISALITVGAMLYVTARIDWRLALVAIAVAPLSLLLTQIYRGRMRQQWGVVKAHETGAQGVMQEVLTSLRLVRAFGQEEHEEQRFMQVAGDGWRSRVRVMFSQHLFELLIGLTSVGGSALVLYIGALGVLDGRLTLGSLLLVFSYLTQIYSPLETMGKKLTSVQNALAGAERAFALLDHPLDVTDPANGIRVRRSVGDLTLEHVSFGYAPPSLVLKDVSFHVPAGARVGIAGRTGAGKTTLLNLITRLYDPTQGSVYLDGVDVRDYRLADLRAQFSIVTQEPILFSTTVRQNIAYGKPDATMDQVKAAAMAANAHDFIAKLSKSYETIVGERGMNLSGGQRQRVALARAFLRDAPVLILDEPTSAVDMKTEADIIEATKRLMTNRTTFVVAHRLSTLEKCDILLVVADSSVRVISHDIGPLLERARSDGSLEAAMVEAV